jgi:hypothetical protein
LQDIYSQLKLNKMINTRNLEKKVIIRADRAGVFFGTLTAKEQNEVVLTNARKLYYWDGAAAVEQLALDGPLNPENCKFTVTVDEITIMQVIQILPCTEKSINTIENVIEWKA